ncbi:Crp/Fnr family transcriptional regulator [Sphingobacterium thalpophilum]|uniref:Crp/Fnr family transcriptional regulator n=1 Tax=Sphingobacterium thalpophilum TaxID=259 RepID=UPI002D787CCF|nr:Crp/Fnr family transcriptional regulator [Sphingobacterium thalpophilum]
MEFDLILKSIAEHVTLNLQEQEFVISLLKVKKVRHRQYLLEAGDIQRHGIFVNSGCLRSYSACKNGIERNLQFAPSGWWIGDLNSLKYRQPSILYIDAIFDSEIIMLANSDQEMLYQSIPQMERYFRLITERAYIRSQQRLVETLNMQAKERYEQFCKQYPDLIRSLPKKHIASYIGVTPEFLSTIV